MDTKNRRDIITAAIDANVPIPSRELTFEQQLAKIVEYSSMSINERIILAIQMEDYVSVTRLSKMVVAYDANVIAALAKNPVLRPSLAFIGTRATSDDIAIAATMIDDVDLLCTVDFNQDEILEVAVALKSRRVVDLIVQLDHDCDCALVVAATHNDIRLLRYELQHGATSYQEAMDSAVEEGHFEIAQVLVDYQMDWTRSACMAARLHREKILDLLLPYSDHQKVEMSMYYSSITSDNLEDFVEFHRANSMSIVFAIRMGARKIVTWLLENCTYTMGTLHTLAIQAELQGHSDISRLISNHC